MSRRSTRSTWDKGEESPKSEVGSQRPAKLATKRPPGRTMPRRLFFWRREGTSRSQRHVTCDEREAGRTKSKSYGDTPPLQQNSGAWQTSALPSATRHGEQALVTREWTATAWLATESRIVAEFGGDFRYSGDQGCVHGKVEGALHRDGRRFYRWRK
jgi:guanyl-specific ribonuclease Sa